MADDVCRTGRGRWSRTAVLVRAVVLAVVMGMVGQSIELAHADEPIIEVGSFDNAPCLAGDDVYDMSQDLCLVLDTWQAEAVTKVRTIRGITGGTDDQVRRFAKGDVRAELYARILQAIETPADERTADQQAVYEWAQNSQKRLNIAIAQQALDEFTEYDGPAGNTFNSPGWCTYTPPAPYTADRPDWSGCPTVHNPLGDLFALPPTYPDAATWVKWGAARVKGADFELADFVGSTELSAAAIAGIAGSTAGVAAGSTVAILNALIGAAFIQVFTPYATGATAAAASTLLGTVGSAEYLATATASMFGAAAFVVVVIAIALYGIIYSGLQVFARHDIRTELENGLATAQAAALPDLGAYTATTEGSAQLYELLSRYLTTYDQWNGNPGSLPARQITDPLLASFESRGATASVQTWAGAPATLEVRSGFLVLDGAATTGAKVLDDRGKPIYLYRSKLGNGEWGFLAVPADTGANSCVTTTSVTCETHPSVKVLDGTGEAIDLSMVTPRLPTIDVHSDRVDVADGVRYDLVGSADDAGFRIDDSIEWWQPSTATHVNLVTSICSPFTGNGTTVPAEPGTEFVDGVCFQRFATGRTAQVNVTSSAPVTVRVTAVGAEGTGAVTRVLDGATGGPTLSLTPQNGAVTEGELIRMAGRIVDPSGSTEPLTVTVDWHDGTTPAVYHVAPGGLSLVDVFTFSRNDETSDIVMSRRFTDEISGTLTVTVSDGTNTTAQSTAYVVGNAAPTATFTVTECDGPLQCIMVPGRTYSVAGEVSDAGSTDVVTAKLVVPGLVDQALALTAVNTPLFGEPKRWSFSGTFTLPFTGSAGTSVAVVVSDADGGTSTATRTYTQHTPPAAPDPVSATVTALDTVQVTFDGGITLLPTSYTATCATLDGLSSASATGQSPITVTGLARSTSYHCRVAGTSEAGTGSASDWSATVTTPSGIPAAPTAVTAATDGANRLRVSFTAAATVVPTAYRVVCTSSDGGTARSASATAAPILVTGLTSAATYTCKVSGTTTVGTGAASASSSPVLVPGTPGAPTAVAAVVSGPTRAAVSFTPPAADGGSPITGYRTLCTSPTGTSRSAQGAASPLVVSGLTAGATYTCVASAVTAIGSKASAASAAFVAVGLPGQPGLPLLSSPSAVDPTFAGKVRVEFGAPATTGGAPISAYRVRCTSDDGLTVRTATGASSPIDVTGFPSPFVRVSCTVAATNSVGTGPATASSSIVLVANVPAKPAAPTITRTAAGRATAVVTAPSALLQFPITSYRVVCTSLDGGRARSASGSSATLVVTGLTVGATYSCVASASNALGSSGAGASTPTFVA